MQRWALLAERRLWNYIAARGPIIASGLEKGVRMAFFLPRRRSCDGSAAISQRSRASPHWSDFSSFVLKLSTAEEPKSAMIGAIIIQAIPCETAIIAPQIGREISPNINLSQQQKPMLGKNTFSTTATHSCFFCI